MLQEEKEKMIRKMMASMSPEQRYKFHYEGMYGVCKEQELGDPFSYARSKEILAASELGHNVSKEYSGADAFNQKNQPVEYKSTIQSKVTGAYRGISNKDTWEEQERYLKNEKIACYPEHYMNRFEDGKLVESWVLTGQKVYEILLPKLKKQYHLRKNSKTTPADPRLNATLSTTEIYDNGHRVI